MFSSGDVPLYLADIHTCSSIALKSRITHTGTVQASTCRVDGWIYDTAAAEEHLSAARCFLSQCQMSACCSRVLVPLPGHFQCKKHCTLFCREMTFSHCSLGSEHKYPVAAETQRTGAWPWAAAGAPEPTAEVPNSCSED